MLPPAAVSLAFASLVLLTPAALGSAPAISSDIHVDAAASCAAADGSAAAPFCRLRDAVQAASSGDRILVAPATYSVPGIGILDDLTIVGTAGAGATILQFGSNSSSINGHPPVGVGAGAEVVLEDLTFTGATPAGAIRNQGRLTMRRCVLSGNSAQDLFWFQYSRAACIEQTSAGSLTLEACELSGNSGDNWSYNPAVGGVIVYGAAPIVIGDCLFHDNAGGHLSVRGPAPVTIEGSTFSGITSYVGGGPADASVAISGPGEIRNSTFSSSTEVVWIGPPPGDELRISSCTFASTLARSTWYPAGDLVLGNSIFAATGGPNGSLVGDFVSAGNNLVAEGQVATGLAATDLVGYFGATLDPGLGVLGDHGGPTPTFALLPTSPAMGAASPVPSTAVDQRGRIRPSGTVDIGAFQSASPSLGFRAPGCWGAVNGGGSVGYTAAIGSAAVADNDMSLAAIDVTPHQFGIFLASRDSGFTALSNGNLCLAGPIGRFTGPGQIQNSGPSGRLVLPIDLTALPRPSTLAAGAPGETWSFQAWHRDTVGESGFAVATAVTLE